MNIAELIEVLEGLDQYANVTFSTDGDEAGILRTWHLRTSEDGDVVIDCTAANGESAWDALPTQTGGQA